MSYDLRLHRKNKIKQPFTEDEIETKLGDMFGYLHVYVEGNYAVGFDVAYMADEEERLEFSHQGEGRGYYSTHCSYGVDKQEFAEAKRLVKDIASRLDLQIEDLQTNSGLMDPEEFMRDDQLSNERFDMGKEAIQKLVEGSSWKTPSSFKHFILYYIISIHPETQKHLLLTLGGYKQYASKVEKGESIDQVVRREIQDLTGNDTYKIMNVAPHDTAKDRFGNELSRYAVFVEIPYFIPDPNKMVLHEKLEWRVVL